MLLTPRYDGSPVLSIEGSPSDVLEPLTRQRRRLTATLAELDDAAWRTPSRCEGWTVQDVVAHLVGVDSFWQTSVDAGVAGAPTRLLAGFDPAATPPMMVGGMRSLSPSEVLDQFRAACDGFLGSVAGLDDAGWGALAESPAGHVSVRLVSAHALWDCW
ncbi:MAG: maleylpyruvate isomerase N-terminal domain-containing protein, partial [Acidimicrobiales bacterium]